MGILINLDDQNIWPVLSLLLQDKTTKRNIIWATSSYASLGEYYTNNAEITVDALRSMGIDSIQPRILKAQAEQAQRTRAHAEVFTPAWVCNQMNNYLDEEWFGRKDVFNIPEGHGWTPTEGPISFPKRRYARWQQYVDSRRLEITCGEAPFIASRYDAATGEEIPIPRRIGLLDRKLRVVNENVEDETEWTQWTIRAFQSVYGYEYQGDNLLLARINLLLTYVEYLEDRWKRPPDRRELKKVANVIAWNMWQMDGLTGTMPLGNPEDPDYQISMDDVFGSEYGFFEEPGKPPKTPPCRIYDWRKDNSIPYKVIGREKAK